MAESNGKFKFVGSVIAGVLAIVFLIYNLVYAPLNAAQSKEAEARQSDFKALSANIAKGDRDNQDTFLLAFKDISAENKKDMKEVFDKISAIQADVAVIKREIRK